MGDPRVWMIAIAFGASACATAPARTVAKPVAPPDDEWARESWDERHDTMEFVVHPNMARLFQANAKKPYPDLTCRSCHGADAEAVNYAMPHGLPALDPAHMPTNASRRRSPSPDSSRRCHDAACSSVDHERRIATARGYRRHRAQGRPHPARSPQG